MTKSLLEPLVKACKDSRGIEIWQLMIKVDVHWTNMSIANEGILLPCLANANHTIISYIKAIE
jgi:hypothetical protein